MGVRRLAALKRGRENKKVLVIFDICTLCGERRMEGYELGIGGTFVGAMFLIGVVILLSILIDKVGDNILLYFAFVIGIIGMPDKALAFLIGIILWLFLHWLLKDAKKGRR